MFRPLIERNLKVLNTCEDESEITKVLDTLYSMTRFQGNYTTVDTNKNVTERAKKNFYKRWNGLKKGEIAETITYNQLMYPNVEKYVIPGYLVLRKDNDETKLHTNTSECDDVVLTKAGIYVIEVKARNYKTITIDSIGNLYIETEKENGLVKTDLENFYKQINIHTNDIFNTLKEISSLNDKIIFKYFRKIVVLFNAAKVNNECEQDVKIVGITNLNNAVYQNNNEDVFTEEELAKLYKELMNYKETSVLEEKPFEIGNDLNVMKAMLVLSEYLKQKAGEIHNMINW